MAESAVSFAVERIGDLLIQKANFLREVREQVERLQNELKRMQCFLKDADARQQEDERVRNWVSEIRNAAYEVEDIVDVFILGEESRSTKCLPTRMFKKLMGFNKVGKKIEAIQVKIQDIARSRETYGINNLGEATNAANQMLWKLRQSSPRVEEDVIVGLKEDADKLVEQLITGDQRRRVVSIVGMGGIGKTTLAKRVYNDSRVIHHFQHFHAWVYISQDCRPRDIFHQIINQMLVPTKEEAEKMEKMQERELGDFLHERVKEKRYLVVLDDIWRSDDWKFLSYAFPKQSNGSRLLLTTRNNDVALQADRQSDPHEMKLLSKEECWKLFCRTAIPHNDYAEDCPIELKKLEEEMVEKCAGLPLAVVVLGGLLSSKKRIPSEWEKVLHSIRAHFSKGKGGVDAVLSLSFIDLPHNLRSCFLYLGIFPEDSVISTRELLHLWIAEGFVLQQDEQRLEETAEDYLNELINRNLLQVAALSINERAKKCRIHDLVRDLCIKKAKEDDFFEVRYRNVPFLSTKSRREGIYMDLQRYVSTEHSSCIRSLLFFEVRLQSITSSPLDFVCNHWQLLRVLHLEISGAVELPNSIGKLIHLRYLKINANVWAFEELPNSLGNLRSLQTLDLRSVRQGPTMIHKMKNLRHLFVSYANNDRKPLRIDTPRNLQTLFSINLNDWKHNDSSKLTSLRKLKIIGIFDLNEDVFSNSIAKLKDLCSLYLDFNESPCFPSFIMNSWVNVSKLDLNGPIRELPKAHDFPPSLTQLTLENSGLSSAEMKILGELPTLLTLRLKSSSARFGLEMQASANGFPQLKILQLSRIYDWFHLNIEKGGMSKLTQLQIYEGNPSIRGLEELSRLQKVDVTERFAVLPRWVSFMASSSNWCRTERTDEKGSRSWHFRRR